MSRRIFRQNFDSFRGLDLRGGPLTQASERFTELQNFLVSDQGEAFITRSGSKIWSPNGQYLGLWTASWSDATTGELMEEIVSLSDKLYRLKQRTFIVTYSGAEAPVQLNLTLDTDTETFKLKIVESIAGVLTTMLDYDIGTGLEAGPVTLANVKTQVDAIAGGLYVATITGTTSTPAALVLPITLNADLSITPFTATLYWYEWEAVNNTVTTPFASYYAARGATNFEHASAINMEGSLYLATGYEYLHKYDGQTCYRVGLPQATAPVPSIGAGGTVTGTYRYYSRLRMTDNRGVERSFELSDVSADLVVTADVVTVNLTNVLAATGYNTHCALINGNQAGITTGVTVTNTPHTMVAGDTAYLLNTATTPPTLVTRVLTAVTATTLSWAATTAIDVTNAFVISAGLCHEVYRNKDGGTLPYLQGVYPNNSFAATSNISDDSTDAQLGVDIDLPQKTPTLLAVKPKYLREHQGMLVCGGTIAEPNTVRFSDVDNIEGFPGASNLFDVPSSSKGGITGLISDYERLIVGQEYSLYSYAGDLDLGGIIPQKIGDGAVGIACHNSIADTEFGVIFLSRIGFRRVRYGQLEDMGDETGSGGPLDPIFTAAGNTASQIPQTKRAWAIVLEGAQTYYCFVPTESGTGTGRYVNDNGAMLWFDWGQRAWGEFAGVNAGGGLCIKDRIMHWQSKRTDSVLTVSGNLSRTPGTNTQNDYADHTDAIECLVATAWDSMGEPSTLKKVLYLKLYSLVRSIYVTAFTVDLTTEVNYVSGRAHSQTEIAFGTTSSSGYGYGAWGIFGWGAPSVKSRRTKLRPARIGSIRFLLSNNRHHQCTAISGLEYEVAAAYSREIKE